MPICLNCGYHGNELKYDSYDNSYKCPKCFVDEMEMISEYTFTTEFLEKKVKKAISELQMKRFIIKNLASDKTAVELLLDIAWEYYYIKETK